MIGIDYIIRTNNPDPNDSSGFTKIFIPVSSLQRLPDPASTKGMFKYKVIKEITGVGDGYLTDKDGNSVSFKSLLPKVGDIIEGGDLTSSSFPTGDTGDTHTTDTSSNHETIFTQRNIIIGIAVLVLIILLTD